MNPFKKYATYSDKDWLDVIANPITSDIPTLPPDNVQAMFTGKVGLDNFKQGFAFYQYIKDNSILSFTNDSDNVKVMDFGAGWGRIARLFLKEIHPDNLYLIDPFTVAVEWQKKTNMPGVSIFSKLSPPIPTINNDTKFDIIYAYSVFSHLSEEMFLTWTKYLLDLLTPNGRLIFTTRGDTLINYYEKLSKEKPNWHQNVNLPNMNIVKSKYVQGTFQFYPSQHSQGELDKNAYGETFIPEQYLQNLFKNKLVSFVQRVPYIDQAVVTLKK